MMPQEALPGFNVHLPICPGCKEPAPVLGQVVPAPSSAYLCRTCTLAYPIPQDVFVEADNRIGIGLQPSMDYAAARECYHSHSQVLEELAKGCMYTLEDVDAGDRLPCMTDDDLWLMNAYGVSGRGWQRDIKVIFERTVSCRRCRNRLKYVAGQRAASSRWIAQHSDGTMTAHTRSMPLCARCGCAHDHRTLSGDSHAYCVRCDDELSVERLLQHKGIFGADDDETILDRLQSAFPELFERGVLPDYWFTLRAKANSLRGE